MRVPARVPVLAIGASLVVEGAFALSAMMDERRKERYRKKRMTRQSTDDDSEIIK